jgi:hypothetical protein
MNDPDKSELIHQLFDAINTLERAEGDRLRNSFAKKENTQSLALYILTKLWILADTSQQAEVQEDIKIISEKRVDTPSTSGMQQSLASELEQVTASLIQIQLVVQLLPSSEEQTAALRKLAVIWSTLERWDKAKTVARSIPIARGVVSTFSAVARQMVENHEIGRAVGILNEAEAIVPTIDDIEDRDEALWELAPTWGLVGELDRAEMTAQKISDPPQKADALCKIATQLIAVSQVVRGIHLLSEAEVTARAIKDRVLRASTLSEVANVLFAAKAYDEAGRVRVEAITVAQVGTTSPNRQESLDCAFILKSIAEDLALVGDLEWALQVTQAIENKAVKSSALNMIAQLTANGQDAINANNSMRGRYE